MSNDFDADLYELNKLVENIFQALNSISRPKLFAFVGKNIDDEAPPIMEELPEIEWEIPLYPVDTEEVSGGSHRK